MKRILAGLAIGLWVIGMTGAASANLITNGSFELGNFTQSGDTMSLPVGSTDITGWTVVSNSIAWIKAPNVWGLSASDGDFFLDLTEYKTSIYGGVSQDIGTTIGQSYTLSFDLGTGPSGGWFSGPISVLASAGSASQSFTLDLDDTWQTFSLDFTAQDASTTICIIGTSGNQYIGLDDVSVTAVPLPASLLLLGSGILGMAGIAGTRKKRGPQN